MLDPKVRRYTYIKQKAVKKKDFKSATKKNKPKKLDKKKTFQRIEEQMNFIQTTLVLKFDRTVHREDDKLSYFGIEPEIDQNQDENDDF